MPAPLVASAACALVGLVTSLAGLHNPFAVVALCVIATAATSAGYHRGRRDATR